MPKEPPSALEKAMRLLTCRALSEAELLRKLRDAGYGEEESLSALAECRKHRFVDDAQLTADSVELLRARNAGSRVIRRKLIQRGLGEQIADGLPEEDGERAEEEAAWRALDFKWRMLSRETDAKKKREKAFRFLVGRGFAPSLIFRLLSRRESTMDEEENQF